MSDGKIDERGCQCAILFFLFSIYFLHIQNIYKNIYSKNWDKSTTPLTKYILSKSITFNNSLLF
jgi:hypothetical protein